MAPEISEIFQKLFEAKEKNKLLFGKEYIDSPYVFTWIDGHPISPDYISRVFKKLLKKYGYKHIRFHDLRHSCATMMLSKGYALKDVPEWLGHTHIDNTADIYGHLDISRKRKIAKSISGISKK